VFHHLFSLPLAARRLRAVARCNSSARQQARTKFGRTPQNPGVRGASAYDRRKACV
jgi:hypothetical protein